MAAPVPRNVFDSAPLNSLPENARGSGRARARESERCSLTARGAVREREVGAGVGERGVMGVRIRAPVPRNMFDSAPLNSLVSN